MCQIVSFLSGCVGPGTAICETDLDSTATRSHVQSPLLKYIWLKRQITKK